MNKLKYCSIALASVLVFCMSTIIDSNNTRVLAETNSNPGTKVTQSAATFKEGVKIKKFRENYSCFQFDTPQGVRIIADPYEIDNPIKADLVTESHEDGDHTDTSKITGLYTLIRTPGNYETRGVKVTALAGRHNKGDEDGTNLIFVYEINGIKIAHFCSQGEVPKPSMLKEIGKVDVLLIQTFEQVYGKDVSKTKLTFDETKKIIDSLKPKLVIPEHGTYKIAGGLAYYLKMTSECVESGEMLITRKWLDSIKTIKIVDLDTGHGY